MGGGNQPTTPRLGFDTSIGTAAVTAWHQMVNGPAERKLPLLHDADWRARARHDWDHPLREQNSFKDLGSFILSESENGAGPLVLLVSPWGDEMDRILAFECGADDFARDPFFPRELASRVQALLRRGRRPRSLALEEGETRVGPVRVDFRKSLVEMDGRPVPLTWREFEVLRLLAQERGRVVRRATLLGLLLGAPDAASPRLIDTYVKSIRRKLGSAGSLIETVRGVGYRLSAG